MISAKPSHELASDSGMLDQVMSGFVGSMEVRSKEGRSLPNAASLLTSATV